MAALEPRSYLFVPGNRPDRFAKALAAGADAVIVDLEDAVGPGEKDAARAMLAEWLAPDRPVHVRVNAADTPWFDADVGLLEHPAIAGVVLPKAERVEAIETLTRRRPVPVMALVETAAGFHDMLALARARHVSRLLFGTIDFQADLGMRAEEDDLAPFRAQFVLASTLAGIAPPVDGVSTAIDDEAVLTADVRRARRLGFGGKLCIHPRQVAIVNAAFVPSEAEVAWARRVVEAIAAAGGGAVALDGKMVDRPVELKARAILVEASRT